MAAVARQAPQDGFHGRRQGLGPPARQGPLTAALEPESPGHRELGDRELGTTEGSLGFRRRRSVAPFSVTRFLGGRLGPVRRLWQVRWNAGDGRPRARR